jgi:hypothetical protein
MTSMESMCCRIDSKVDSPLFCDMLLYFVRAKCLVSQIVFTNLKGSSPGGLRNEAPLLEFIYKAILELIGPPLAIKPGEDAWRNRSARKAEHWRVVSRVSGRLFLSTKFLAAMSSDEHSDTWSDEISNNSSSLEDNSLDSEDDYDISTALTGTKRSQSINKASTHDNEVDGDEDADLDDIIRETMAKRNVKDGTDILKKTKGKKIAKGEVGGGSFQSMGLCFHFHLDFLFPEVTFPDRIISLATSLPYTSGIPCTYTYSAFIYPTSIGKSTQRSCGNGKNGLGKISRLHGPTGTASWRSSFH